MIYISFTANCKYLIEEHDNSEGYDRDVESHDCEVVSRGSEDRR